MKQQIVRLLLLLSVLVSIPLHAQESYAELTQAALETMWKLVDSVTYRKSLAMYEHAFALFPDSIEDIGLYKVGLMIIPIYQIFLMLPLATIRNASISRPESVSSRIVTFGSSIAIWKISLRFFSPPEKP